MTTPYAHLPYRPCVGMMLLNPKKQVFVAQRIDTSAEAWQMPQGGVDAGEDPQAAVFRELAEEIGTQQATILGESRGWLSYDLPTPLVPQVWGGKHRGQTQKWFCLRFDGEDGDINLNTEEPEFHSWRWVAPVELPGLIVPFKRDLYTQLLEEFREFLG